MSEDTTGESPGAVAPSRRSLLKKAAVAGGAIWIAPSVTTLVLPADAQNSGAGGVPIYLSNGHSCPGGATDLSTPIQNGDNTVSIAVTASLITVDIVFNGNGPNVMPNGTYDIWVNQSDAGDTLGDPWCPTSASDTMTISGNAGTKQTTKSRNASATNFWISLTGGGQVWRSAAVIVP